MPTHFHIVIPVHNRVQTTLRVLGCLAAQSERSFTVWLVDDGSTDGTADEARAAFGDRLDLRILTGDGSLFWGGAVHMGMEETLKAAGDADVLVMMNDDITFEPDFLARAAGVAAAQPTALFGAMVLDDHDRDRICKSGITIKSWSLSLNYRPYEGWSLARDGERVAEFTPVDGLRALATFVPVAVARRIGNIAHKALPHYHSDFEYTYRARRAGYPVLIARDVRVFHSVATTGGFNAYSTRASLADFVRSLWDIRSPNGIKHRLNYAWLCCPKAELAPYLVTDALKTLARCLLMVGLRERAFGIRVWMNRMMGRSGRGAS